MDYTFFYHSILYLSLISTLIVNCVLYIIPLSWEKENVIRKIYKNLKLDIDISVLQSASIKTLGGYNTNTMKKTFILHFATINTLLLEQLKLR